MKVMCRVLPWKKAMSKLLLTNPSSWVFSNGSSRFDKCGQVSKIIRRESASSGKESDKSCPSKTPTGPVCKDDVSRLREMKASQCKETRKQKKEDSKPKVTLIEGEGVGPEITEAVRKVFEAAKVPIEWEIFETSTETLEKGEVAPELIESLLRNKVGINGPIGCPIWKRKLYKQFQVFAFVTNCCTLEGLKLPYDHIDCIVIRDQTEGEYSGIEHNVVPGIVQTIKVSTRAASKRLSKYVFHHAAEKDRKKITVAHKANIMDLTDGKFLKSMRETAAKHSEEFQFEERYMDTVCLNMFMKPKSYEVLVSSSMYGDLLSVVGASIMGGLAMCPCFNTGPKGKLYSSQSRIEVNHAGQNTANPTGLLLSTVTMLHDMKLDEYADKIENAVKSIYKDTTCRTQDLGGDFSCTDFTDLICETVCEAP